ncbi:MAG: DUF3613 domain-containing protein, partial [Methylococcales bacterium]
TTYRNSEKYFVGWISAAHPPNMAEMVDALRLSAPYIKLNVSESYFRPNPIPQEVHTMNRFIIMVLSSALFATCFTARAAELPTESFGSDVRQWMELQRSGVAASLIRQTVSGPVAEKIHERYVQSFTHPIPEYFRRNDNY